MKKIYYLIMMCLFTVLSFGQVGINTDNPNGLLEVNSGNTKNQGIVLPIVSKYEDVVNLPGSSEPVVVGTFVYDESRNTICFKTNTGWSCGIDKNNDNADSPSIPDRQTPYLKASNTRIGARFGYSVALSSNGTTLAVGAYGEDSGSATDPNDTSTIVAGAVYVFTRSGDSWILQKYLKASNIKANAQFGYSVALSYDGNTLAVGARGENSNSATDPNDKSAADAGAVYVFTRSGTSWTQQKYLKASNVKSYAFFGQSIALSSDGNTLAVGAYSENSNSATNPNDTSVANAGAVYVFTRSGSSWTQKAFLKASNVKSNTFFGDSVALSSDGNTLAVGAYGENANSATNPNDTSANIAGAVYVFTRSGSSWTQQAFLKASNVKASARFGDSIALSSDGNTLAVGAPYENSGSETNPNDTSVANSGAIYVFTRSGSSWTQQKYLKASNIKEDANFGQSVALSPNGTTLVVGAQSENSGSGTNPNDTSADYAGAVYVFTRSGNTWTQKAYLKASNVKVNGRFGWSVALSPNETTLVVGAYGENSRSTDEPDDTSATLSGAVYTFETL